LRFWLESGSCWLESRRCWLAGCDWRFVDVHRGLVGRTSRLVAWNSSIDSMIQASESRCSQQVVDCLMLVEDVVVELLRDGIVDGTIVSSVVRSVGERSSVESSHFPFEFLT
jgi:hypothetical protein